MDLWLARTVASGVLVVQTTALRCTHWADGCQVGSRRDLTAEVLRRPVNREGGMIPWRCEGRSTIVLTCESCLPWLRWAEEVHEAGA